MQIIKPPAKLPVSVAQLAARWRMANPDNEGTAEVIRAATAWVETASARPIMPRVVRFDLPEGEWSEWWVPVAPVIGFADPAATGTVLRAFGEPRISRTHLPGASVDLAVGYADEAAIPHQLLQAIALIAREWGEMELTVGEAFAAPQVSVTAQRLVKQVRYRRPRECC